MPAFVYVSKALKLCALHNFLVFKLEFQRSKNFKNMHK